MKRQILFKHSGNTGDIVYALPVIRAAVEQYDIDAHLRIKIDVPMQLTAGSTHPNGSVMVTAKMRELTIPLIDKAVPYIKSCKSYDVNEPGEIVDLDAFRKLQINYVCGNISTWYADITGAYPALERKWLHINDEDVATVRTKLEALQPGFTTIVARSSRYRNPNISFKNIDSARAIFVGHSSEWPDLQASLPHAKCFDVKDFYELACVISASKLFIGNQSMPFAVAEGLKHPRLLEPCLYAGNVHPVGGVCSTAYTQSLFDAFQKRIIG